MTKHYENSRLWKEAFSDSSDTNARKLAAEYDAAWDKACSIASRIQSDALGLTLHDGRHFSALWNAADLLVPTDLKLTPVEVFIFGVAILIHDAAHTTLAYEGGIQELSKTPEWADNLVSRLGEDQPKGAYELENVPENIRRIVLFDTVRALHAKQATKILRLPFGHPSFEANIYLIDDPIIRNHMAEVIGQVAASHHWDLADVAKLHKSLNVTSPYSIYGPIRPLFLAGLMRTSDAIQIDNSRAPDFEFALAKPSGLSGDHWSAQNRLATGVDPSDPQVLLVNSTAAFSEADAPAWWIAYDLARVADRELRNTDALLRDYAQPRLSLLGVKDVGEPIRFSNHVKTDGWWPLDAEVKIGDTPRLINLFGGSELYGDEVAVPLRELIQNAVDAIRGRRLVDVGFAGKITVELVDGVNSAGRDGYWLRVSDDGIGMSPAILTGPFITFGESGWTSAALRSERPGFLGKRFRHIGKFGIGFFSVFMIGDEVKVVSRPFDAAGADAKLLHFKSGVGLRPLVKDCGQSTMSVVTSVEVFINEDTKTRLMHHRRETTVHYVGRPPTKEPAKVFSMIDLVGVICPAIDVEIEAFDCDSEIRAAIKGDWTICDGAAWLRRINGIDSLPKVVSDNIGLMTLVGEASSHSGRASLNPLKQELGIYTVGGLALKRREGVGSPQNFFGSLDRKPSGPKREPRGLVDKGQISAWATEQAKLWAKADIAQQERNFIAANAAYFGGDPFVLANAQIDSNWHSLEEIYDRILSCGVVRAPIRPDFGRNGGWSIMPTVNLSSGLLYHRDDVEVELKNVMLAGASGDIWPYWTIPENEHPIHNSLIGSLRRFAEVRGKVITLTDKKLDYGYYKGPTVRQTLVTHGERLILDSIELSLADE